MVQSDNSVCIEMFLDLICYEMRRRNLSPEMEHMFLNHLAQCPECRTKVLGFTEVLGGWYVPSIPQFGARN